MVSPRSIERAAAKAAAARHQLEEAIREAHAQGMSLRELAPLAGLSHETIRRICSR